MALPSPLKEFKIRQLHTTVKAHITRDIMFTLINSLWRIVSAPVTVIFIPLFLTPETQGFWFVFISLAALSVFADLGFTTIVSQFAAHEYAYLTYNKHTGLFEGEVTAIKRIGSLLRFVTRWSLTVSAIGFPVILAIGIYMFHKKTHDTFWLIPWIIYGISSGISFTTTVLLSFFEGCSQIAAIEKNKFIGSVSATIFMLNFLFFGFGLYSLAITAILVALINITLLLLRFKTLLVQLLHESKSYVVNWKDDFLKLIWRYAISWSSGYFIFQMYAPLMFQFGDTVESGKVGISITLATATFTIANVWMYVANPKLNALASLGNWEAMDKVFLKNIVLSGITFFLGATQILAVIWFLGDKIPFLQRFLGFTSMSILFAAWLFQIIINGLALYLRAHKKEPFMMLSIASAVYIAVTTLLAVKFLQPQYLFIGFLTAQFWALPWAIVLFVKKRKEWHTINYQAD